MLFMTRLSIGGGLITVTPNFKIIISSDIRDVLGGRAAKDFFKKYNGQTINLPEKFLPKIEFLEFHNDMIFENWKKVGLRQNNIRFKL